MSPKDEEARALLEQIRALQREHLTEYRRCFLALGIGAYVIIQNH